MPQLCRNDIYVNHFYRLLQSGLLRKGPEKLKDLRIRFLSKWQLSNFILLFLNVPFWSPLKTEKVRFSVFRGINREHLGRKRLILPTNKTWQRKACRDKGAMELTHNFIKVIPRTESVEIRETSILYVPKFFRKINNFYLLIIKRPCEYHGVRNVSFSENFMHVLNRWSLGYIE